jgi:hypothetical protein
MVELGLKVKAPK